MYSVKYSTTTPTGSLRKGNAVMNITQDNDGPTSTTGFYNGIVVPEGGYLVILTNSGASPAYWPCVGDTQLINLARNRFDQTSISQIRDAVEYFAGRTDTFILTYVPNEIVTDSLELYFNPKIPSSYPTTGDGLLNLSGANISGRLLNGTSFNANNNSLSFDGVDDVVDLPVEAIGEWEELTLLVTVKPNSTQQSGWNAYVGSYTTSPGLNLFLGIDDSKAVHFVEIDTADGNFSFEGSDIIYDQWYQSVLVYGNGELREYKNGELQPISTGASGPLKPNTQLRLGSYNNTTSALNGEISEVQAYSRVLSDTEIKQNYFGGKIVTDGLVFNVDPSNLVSYENGSTTTYSLTGSLSGSLINGVEFNPYNGGVWSFDGVDDFINTNSTFSSYLNETLPISFEVWVYVNLSDNDEMFFGSSWSNGGVLMRKTGTAYTANKVRFLLFTDGSNGGGLDSSVLTSPGWYHCVGTYNGGGLASSSNFKLYINGESDGTSAQFGTPTTIPVTNNVYLGQSGQAGSNKYFTGNMGITRIYNKALTETEVKQNFEAQKSKFGF